MAALSNDLENKLINHLLRNTQHTTPGLNVWVSLYTVAAGEADAGTEVTGGSYARVQVTGWDAPTDGATANTAVITFPTATANWGTIVAVAIRDAAAAGNLLFHGNLAVAQPVNSGSTFKFAAGDLDASLA